MRQSTAENLKDVVSNLGGVPSGRTTTELVNQLENLVSAGGATQQEVAAACVEYLATSGAVAQAVEAYLAEQSGELDSSDFDDIFGE